MRDTILAILDSETPGKRVVVAMRQLALGGSELVLRHESWSENVGWFVQSCVGLSGDQIGELRSVLGVVPSGRPKQRPFAASGGPSGDCGAAACLPFPAHRAG